MNQNWQKPSSKTNWVRFYSMMTIFILTISVIGLETLRINVQKDVDQYQQQYFSPTEKVNKQIVEPSNGINFEKKIRPILNKTSAKVSVAVFYKKNGQLYDISNTNQKKFPSASIIKTDFLVELLHQHRKLEAPLTANEKNITTRMIENSDNEAATSIYNEIGSVQGLQQLFNNLGMNDSIALTTGWALTPTTPQDQVKLLNLIFYDKGYLPTRSKKYIKYLMANVSSDQNWGISAGSKHFRLKNGWKQMSNGYWIVNSIGYLGEGNNSCTIAIMSENNSTLESGETLLEKISEQVSKELKIN